MMCYMRKCEWLKTASNYFCNLKVLSVDPATSSDCHNHELQSVLFSSSQLSSKHNLEDSSPLICCSGQFIQQKANVKLLGVIFDQHRT